jgi:hypothetical protein
MKMLSIQLNKYISTNNQSLKQGQLENYLWKIAKIERQF